MSDLLSIELGHLYNKIWSFYSGLSLSTCKHYKYFTFSLFKSWYYSRLWLWLLVEELLKKLKNKNLLAVLFGVESRFTFFFRQCSLVNVQFSIMSTKKKGQVKIHCDTCFNEKVEEVILAYFYKYIRII